jgi:hypothetical protein
MWTEAWFKQQSFEGWKSFGELIRANLPERRGV